MNKMNVLIIGQGNSGTLKHMIELSTSMIISDEAKAAIFRFFIDQNIKGADAYVVCDDLCGGNHLMIVELLATVDDDVIKKASQQQDYSGRKIPAIKALRKKYLSYA